MVATIIIILLLIYIGMDTIVSGIGKLLYSTRRFFRGKD